MKTNNHHSITIVQTIILLTITVLFSNCSKKDVAELQPEVKNEIISQQLSIKDGRLVIDRSFYETSVNNGKSESVIGEISKSKKFLSYKNFINNKFGSSTSRVANSDTANVPIFLQEILNPDNIVQIGDYIFQLNFHKKIAYGIFLEDSSLIQNIINGEYSSTMINAIPFNQSALQIMDSVRLRSKLNKNQVGRSEIWAYFCSGSILVDKVTWVI